MHRFQGTGRIFNNQSLADFFGPESRFGGQFVARELDL
jgi:hypothetical protein